jgi:integrase
MMEARNGEGIDACLRHPGGRQVWRRFTYAKHGGRRAAIRAAETWLEKEKQKRDNGQVPNARVGVTFREAAEYWQTQGRTRENWKVSTQKDYRSAVDVHLMPVFGDVPLGKLTAAGIDAWLSERINDGLSRRVAQKLHTIIGAIFEAARTPFGIETNPIRQVRPVKQDEAPEIEPYSKEELYALYRAAASEQDRLMFRVAAELGLRRGEQVALRVGDVKFARRQMHVGGSYTHGLRTTPKSEKGKRDVDIPRDLLLELDDHLKHRGDPPREHLLFPAEDGGYLDGSALRRRFVKARDAAGLRPLRYHDLRHTCLSHWDDQGMPPWKLQRMAGHSSVRTSERYIHTIADEPRSEAREQLDQLLHEASERQVEQILQAAVAVLAPAAA